MSGDNNIILSILEKSLDCSSVKMGWSLIFVLILLRICEESTEARDTYSAVVVEYSPTQDPSVDSYTNILNNVGNYVHFINTANSQFQPQPDIIIFPEEGLIGLGNQKQYVEVPDPQDQIRLCATANTYDAALVQLSCAARAAQTYIVVNLAEKFNNTSQQKTEFFNTDVVFDSNGTIIARYRKIHLFSEPDKQPSPNKELVYFDTDFGVRFGIFTCFDIIFEDPGIILANKFNITHFIFPTAWFSQMPFLAAIQEQNYWAYTQDVVLLASGYNNPSMGSSGTGIYLGRCGPLIYNMTEVRQSIMLQAEVPKKFPPKDSVKREYKSKAITLAITKKPAHKVKAENSTVTSQEKLKLKQEDFLKMYTTKSIIPPESDMKGFNGTDFTVPFSVEDIICQNSLCCYFSLNISAVFNKTKEAITRGDDYSQLFYRLAVFDGVRHFDHVATGGLQTCAIIPCVNTDILSCGLRSDDSSATPNTIYDFYQTDYIFKSIYINGNFSSNHSSVGPNVLLKGKGDNYGSILPPESFIFSENASDTSNYTVEKSFKTVKQIPSLVTASLYGRLFFRDSQPDSGQQSSSEHHIANCLVLLITFILINYIQY